MNQSKRFINIVHIAPLIGEEDYPYFVWQQDENHRLGLKSTVYVPYTALLLGDKMRRLLKDRNEFGDEIGLCFWVSKALRKDLGCEDYPELFFHNYPRELKSRAIDLHLQKFHELFGIPATSIHALQFDAFMLRYIKERQPEVISAVHMPFEEGMNAFRGHKIGAQLLHMCEGGPWWPWVPTIENSICPAGPEDGKIDLVCVPWLVRDMIQAFDARDDYASSELGDLFRSKTASPEDISYLERMVKQFLSQDRFNEGYGFFTMLQECAWFWEGPHFHEVSCSVYQKSYLDYLRLLKREAEKLGAMFVTVGEFSRWYQERYSGGTGTTTCLWSDIKYGSRKQYLWHLDRNFRVMFDLNQGGAICDLRPYGGKFKKTTGIDSPWLWDGAYPYLIQAHHRYGTICKGIVRWGDEERDLSLFRAKVQGDETLKHREGINLAPILLEFLRGTIEVKTILHFDKSGFSIERTLIVPGKSLPDDISLEELFIGCWGTGDFQIDLRGLVLNIDGPEQNSLTYEHLGRTIQFPNGTTVGVYIPEGDLTFSMSTNMPCHATIQEGTLGEPMYRLSLMRSGSHGNSTFTVYFKTYPGKYRRD